MIHRFLINIFKTEIFDLKVDVCKNLPFLDQLLPIFSGFTGAVRIKLFARDSTRGALSYDTKIQQIGAFCEKIFVLENESRTKLSYIYN